jgi:hypothetical protein
MTKHSIVPAILFGALSALLAPSCAAPPGEPESAPVEVRAIRAEPAEGEDMTVEELQAELLAVALQALAEVQQAVYELSEQPLTPTQRSQLNGVILSYERRLMMTATEPNPLVATLDLAVMTRLARHVIEEEGDDLVGMPTGTLLDAARDAEGEVWSLVARVLTPEQHAELDALIEEWRAEHPGQLAVTSVRFRDFAGSRLKSTLADAEVSPGFLAPVGSATRAMEELRLTGERAMVRAGWMPGHLRRQSLQVIYDTLALEEIEQLIDRSERSVVALERFAAAFVHLPDDLAAEREAFIEQAAELYAAERAATIDEVSETIEIAREEAIDHFMGRLADERQSLFEDLDEHEAPLRSTLTELREALAVGNELATSVNLMISSIADMQAGEPADPAQPPFDIRNYGDAADDVGAAAGELTQLVRTLNELLASPAWAEGIGELTSVTSSVERDGERLLGKAFQLALLLGAILIGLSVAARVLTQYLSRRLLGPARP